MYVNTIWVDVLAFSAKSSWYIRIPLLLILRVCKLSRAMFFLIIFMYQACIAPVSVRIQMDNILVCLIMNIHCCLQLAKRRRVSLDAGMASGNGVLSPPPITPLCTPSQPSHSNMETQIIPSEKSTQHQVIPYINLCSCMYM